MHAARKPIPEACNYVDPEVHDKIIAAAARDGVSVSAWMTAAAREALQRQAGLVAADQNDRRTWAEHKARLEVGVVPAVPSPVVAQVSRSATQVQLRRFLAGCAVVPLGESEAHEAGRLLGKSKTADVVDAIVVTIALRQHATILTSDLDDMKRLVAASGLEVAVVAVPPITTARDRQDFRRPRVQRQAVQVTLMVPSHGAMGPFANSPRTGYRSCELSASSSKSGLSSQHSLRCSLQ